MATLRDIRRRIAGVKNTQQITRAMKMVAAAKLRRAQDNIINARPYAKKIAQVVDDLIRLEPDSTNPLIVKREVRNVAVVVVTADRGLCGSFNINIIKEAMSLLQGQYADYYRSGNLYLYNIGKKGLEYFSRVSCPVVGARQGIFSDLKFAQAASIVSELTEKYLNGEIDEVLVVYNEFKSVIQQRVVVETLLPIGAAARHDAGASVKPANEKILKHAVPGAEGEGSVDFIYEPDRKSILNYLLPKHLNSQMWRILLESYAAELGAKMTAMDLATENAKELIRSLQVTYNKERQSSITTEILEIVSGANALKG
ncbi:MAG: ATP synthase F1 subunit gamma [Bacteroidota bacterium]